jgi:hypothetical protein
MDIVTGKLFLLPRHGAKEASEGMIATISELSGVPLKNHKDFKRKQKQIKK